MGEFVAGVFLFFAGALLAGGIVASVAHDVDHAELCPTILEQSLTAADSLAVFQKHEGCWEFVQKQTL